MSSGSEDVARYRLSEGPNERTFRNLIVPARLSGYQHQDRPFEVLLVA